MINISIFGQIVDMASDSKSHTLREVMLRAKVLASRLKRRKFRRWLEEEINGYPVGSQIPEYRILPSQVTGEFSTYGFGQTSIPMSVNCIEDKMRDTFTIHREYNGIAYIEGLISKSDGLIGKYYLGLKDRH